MGSGDFAGRAFFADIALDTFLGTKMAATRSYASAVIAIVGGYVLRREVGWLAFDHRRLA